MLRIKFQIDFFLKKNQRSTPLIYHSKNNNIKNNFFQNTHLVLFIMTFEKINEGNENSIENKIN